MPTLLVSSLSNIGARKLAVAARAAGWDVEWMLDREAPTHLKGREVVYYGDTDLATVAAAQLGLAILEPTFDLLARLPRKYTRREVRYLTLAEAQRRNRPAFVKPADPLNKCFDTGVYSTGADISIRVDVPPSTPVLVSEPVSWTTEYRCFILERDVATCSPYVRYGRLVRAADGSWPSPKGEMDQVVSFCRTVLVERKVRFPPGMALDIGWLEEGGWAIVELNPASSAGLYGCDPASVLPVLRRVCVRRAMLTREDRAWVIARG